MIERLILILALIISAYFVEHIAIYLYAEYAHYFIEDRVKLVIVGANLRLTGEFLVLTTISFWTIKYVRSKVK